MGRHVLKTYASRTSIDLSITTVHTLPRLPCDDVILTLINDTAFLD